jgi:hypothetical protein
MAGPTIPPPARAAGPWWRVRGLAQAALIGGLIGCSPALAPVPTRSTPGVPLLPPAVPDSGGPGDSGGDGGADSGGGGTDPDPWSDEAFYLDPGPLYEALDFTSERASEYFRWEVRMSTSTDGHTWSTPVPIAHNMSSLDLYVHEDAGLVIAGGPFIGLSNVDNPRNTIFALTTPDLERWGSRGFVMDGPVYNGGIDPALHLTADGQVAAIYYSPDGEQDSSIDPSMHPGPHPVAIAYRNEDGLGFTEAEERIGGFEGLVDPTLCVWDGRRHLFATAYGTMHAVDDDAGVLQVNASFHQGNVQVPYCFIRDGEQQVVVQAGGGRGEPTVQTLVDGTTGFTDPTPFFEGEADPFEGRCTSPVLGQLRGTWAMFCAIWIE